MVSDIYFPVPPSPYPAFIPISYPIIHHATSRPLSAQNLHATNVSNAPKHHDQVFDANRNHIAPYYYSETLSPNVSVSSQVRTRHTLSPFHDRPHYGTMLSPRQSRMSSPVTPELSHSYATNNSYYLQPFRPYSVLESTSKSLEPRRPFSAIPISEQFRPASAFFQNEMQKSNEVPDWKARLQKEISKPTFRGSDKPLRQICRIPNCKCRDKPIVDPERFSQLRSFPKAAERSMNKNRNLSLPTLKLDELDDGDKAQAERDTPGLSKPISEQNLGYV